MILYLTGKNFSVRGGNLLLDTGNGGGDMIVFFKKSDCAFCKSFEPIFQACSASEPRINWGIADLDGNPDIIQKSRNTKNPIKTVPFIMLYIEGQPKAIYTSKDRSKPAVLDFVNVILENSRNSRTQRFTPHPQQQQYQQQQPQYQQQPQTQQQRYREPVMSKEDVPNFSVDYVPYNIPWKNTEQRN